MSDTPSPLDELERLKAEMDEAEAAVTAETGVLAWVQSSERLSRALLKNHDYLLSAAREREELRADAARYRWFREWCDIHFNDDGTFSHLENSYGTPNPKTELTARLQAQLDAAIDAARKGDGG